MTENRYPHIPDEDGTCAECGAADATEGACPSHPDYPDTRGMSWGEVADIGQRAETVHYADPDPRWITEGRPTGALCGTTDPNALTDGDPDAVTCAACAGKLRRQSAEPAPRPIISGEWLLDDDKPIGEDRYRLGFEAVAITDGWSGGIGFTVTRPVAEAIVAMQAQQVKDWGGDADRLTWDGAVLVLTTPGEDDSEQRVEPDQHGHYRIGWWTWYQVPAEECVTIVRDDGPRKRVTVTFEVLADELDAEWENADEFGASVAAALFEIAGDRGGVVQPRDVRVTVA